MATFEPSSLTLNRLSIYLRALRELQEEGVERISSKQLAARFRLSATLIRKDLAQFGEFGIRGIGYDVELLSRRLNTLLGLDRRHRIVVVGMGGLGSALSRYLGFNSRSFEVVAGFDVAPEKIGSTFGHLVIQPITELAAVIRRQGATIGILAVPGEAAPAAYERLADAGIRAVLNFAPVRLPARRDVRVKNVDFRIELEELAYFLGR